MARAFRRTRRGLSAQLDDVERILLSRLLDDVQEMLADDVPPETDPLALMMGISKDAHTPEDPALARLLPPASRDDDEASVEFRRLTERGLRARKCEHLRAARATLERQGSLLLSDDEAQAWLKSLTDVRLVLGERLGLRTDLDAERLHEELSGADTDDAEDPRAYLAAVYDFLTWLQESLAEVLLADLPTNPKDPGRGGSGS